MELTFQTLKSERDADGVHSVSSITISFTPSQVLLLLIPDLSKIAVKICPVVINVIYIFSQW
jgi:hypothetical protein